MSSLSTLESVSAPTTEAARTRARTSRIGESEVEMSTPMSTNVSVFARVVNWERLVPTTATARATTIATPVAMPAILVIDFGGTSYAHFSWRTSITVNRMRTATAPM